MSDTTVLPSIAQMTWYTYRNYGTVLQAYALHDAIKRLGYEVSMLNYDPETGHGASRTHSWRKASVLRPIAAAKHIVLGDLPLSSSLRESLFADFISETINVTPPVQFDGSSGEQRTIATFDGFVCGSDQIWSPRFYNPHYYLDFVDEPHKKIAYAPSFGCDTIVDQGLSSRIAAHLADFGNVSVRENSGAELVRDLTGRDVPIAVDPTLLLDQDDWSALSSDSAVPDSPYCLCYFLGNNRDNWAAAEKVAATLGLPVVIIPVFDRDWRRRSSLDAPVGPKEFLGLLEHATCVCTDSFHGMVFATIFGTPLYAFERFNPADPASQNTRIYSFLDMIEGRDLIVSPTHLRSRSEFTPASGDYARANTLISTRRTASLSYLSNALNSATSRKQKEGSK